jgi:1-acyl-sn-glycerol-3-phosphate acyltransferase
VRALPVLLAARPEFKPRGSVLARGILRCLGWRLQFDGLPARQGVILVYPHTSNWDFAIGVLTKWALGLQIRFWGKDSLFKVPGLGAWARWIGGIPLDRQQAHGVVGQTVAAMQQARARGELFWLAAAPEGTRSLTRGWRSGAYQVAVQAAVPAGLAYFDVSTRTVGLTHFLQLSGDVDADFAAMRAIYAGKTGFRPALASPVQLR